MIFGSGGSDDVYQTIYFQTEEEAKKSFEDLSKELETKDTSKLS